MKGSTRVFSGFAAMMLALGLNGCGGNSGTQPTSLERNLDLSSVTVYSPARGARTPGADPIALFSTEKGQTAVLWGHRSETDGSITDITETAYYTDIDKPLYAKYNSEGGLTVVKDIDSGSYVTFSELEDNSLVATGFDASTEKTGSIRATLSNVGVTIEVLDEGRVTKRQVVRPGDFAPRLPGRDDPLAGLATIPHDSENRARIITAIFRAASIVVDHPFDQQIRDIAPFLMLDQLSKSYTEFDGVPASSSDETPVPYISELP